VPGIEVATFDDADAQCSTGKIGRIKVRANSCDGATMSCQDRWIDLGDAGWISPENELYVLGRASDLGVTQADFSLVYEIEHLFRLEWDLTDTAALLIEALPAAGKPELWIGVVGNKDATAEKLTAMLRRRGLYYDIKLFEVSTIPRGANGKVNRQQLLALLREVAIASSAA
jgi:acyl-CoA synthetase (AMP-forming)/AMP-acid ligase II